MSTDKKVDAKPATPISAETIALAAALRKGATIDKKSGVVTLADEQAFVSNLPETVTKEQAVALNKYTTQFVAAASLVTGELGNDAMKKNKELEQATLTVPTIARDKFSVSYDRSREVNVPGRNGEPATKKTAYGGISASFSISSVKGSGDLGKVKAQLAEAAAAAFADLAK